MSAWTVIGHVEVPSGGQAEIEFSSIPQTYTDLFLVLSCRTNEAGVTSSSRLELNSSGGNSRRLNGNGSTVTTGTNATLELLLNGTSSSASTFSNIQIYIPNYTSSSAKSISIDQVVENNATEGFTRLTAGLSTTTSSVTSAKVYQAGVTIAQYSSATLYGVLKGSSGGVTVS
jgi:hypothetical protein